MYKIDLTSLLRLFEEFQRSGNLVAEIPRGTFGLKETGIARVELLQGKVVACLISKRDGSYYATGSDALSKLQLAGNLKWRVEAEAQPPPPRISGLLSSPPPPSMQPVDPPRSPTVSRSSGYQLIFELIPVRLDIPVPDQHVLRGLTFKQRRVLALIDGTRSIARIADLLSLPVGEVQSILVELQAMRLIVINR